MAELPSIFEYKSMTDAQRNRVKAVDLRAMILNAPSVEDIIANLQTSIDDLSAKIDSNHAVNIATSKSVSKLVVDCRLVEDENKKLRRRIENLEQRSRICNLEIVGIGSSESSAAEDEMAAIKLFEEIGVEVYPKEIDACHKVPTKRKNKIKPIIICFCSRKTKNTVLAAYKLAKRKMIEKKIFINEHLSPYNRFLFSKALPKIFTPKTLKYQVDIWRGIVCLMGR